MFSKSTFSFKINKLITIGSIIIYGDNMLKKIICLLFILSMISCVTKEEDKISKSSKSASPEENQTPQEPVPSGSSVGDINPTNRVGVQLRAFPYTNEGYSEFQIGRAHV